MQRYLNTIEEFRKLKKEICFKKDWLLVGIDVAKQWHWAHFMVSDGKEIRKKFRFLNNQEGFGELMKEVLKLQEQVKAGQILFGVEATAGYEKHLAFYLKERFYPVVILPTLAVRRNREILSGSWGKTDARDARNIAYLLKQGIFQFYYFRDEKLEEVVRLIRLDEKLRDIAIPIKARFTVNIIPRCFPELPQVLKQTGTVTFIDLLDCFPTPHHILKETEESFSQNFPKVCGLSNASSKSKKIYELAQRSIALQREMSMSDVLEVKVLANYLRQLRQHRAMVQKRIHLALKGMPIYDLLLTIPSIGTRIAALFAAEIGDIGRFDHINQFIKFMGFDLAQNESGQSKGTPKMSKRGGSRFRHALWLAIVSACSNPRDKNPNMFRAKFIQMMNKRQNNADEARKVKAALCVKLLRVIWAILRDQKPYQDHSYRRGIKIRFSEKLEGATV